MKFVLLVVLSLKLGFVFAQYEKSFSPSAFQDTIPTAIYNNLKNRLAIDKAKVTTKGKVGNYIKSLYDQRFDYVVKSFNADYFMTTHPLTDFLRTVTDRIYRSNPQLSNEVSVYGFSSSVPNAVSFGEGTVCVMLGLLERLETEDQVAYVLCHELAHYYANHAEKSIADLAALNYDKELKHKIDGIMSSPYGRYSKLKALFSSLDLSVTKHSRRSEFEADSLGLLYYTKTGYSKYAPLRVMQILEKADKGVYPNNIDFKKHFNTKDFPFKDSWLDYSKSELLYVPIRDGESDTLRMHPNCKRRFVKLQQQLGLHNVDSALLQQGTQIKPINHLASLEVINSHYHFRQYGKALFYSLLLAEKLPENPYPQAMIAKSLYQLYKAQKDHKLHKVLELPDPRFDENYDRFLTFVHKLRLHELASLAYEYATTRPASFYGDEEGVHALWLCSRFEFSKVDDEKVRQEYMQLFPKGKYIFEMKSYK